MTQLQRSHTHCHFSCVLRWSPRSPLTQCGRLQKAANAWKGGVRGTILGAGCCGGGGAVWKSRPSRPEAGRVGGGHSVADGYQNRNLRPGVQTTGQLTHAGAWRMKPCLGDSSPRGACRGGGVAGCNASWTLVRLTGGLETWGGSRGAFRDWLVP